MAFRLDEQGNLVAFAGNQTNQITVNGRVFVFSDAPLPQIGWGPVEPKRRVPGGAVLQILIHGTGQVRIPITSIFNPVQVFAEGVTPGSRGNEVSARLQEGQLFLEISPEVSGRWLYVVPKS